jgi:hypothetical protein
VRDQRNIIGLLLSKEGCSILYCHLVRSIEDVDYKTGGFGSDRIALSNRN